MPRVDLPVPALGPALEFMSALWALDHALQRRSKWMARRQGVTAPQRLALRLVGCMPDVSAGHLASALKVHPSTLTGVLRRLERRGFLRRRSDRADRRRVRLELTARGRAVCGHASGSTEATVARVLRRTTPHQRQATSALLASLAAALEVESPAAK